MTLSPDGDPISRMKESRGSSKRTNYGKQGSVSAMKKHDES